LKPDSARLRLAHVIPSDCPAGVETAARGMAGRDDLDCEFHLFVIAGETLAPENSAVTALGWHSPLNPLAQVGAALAIARWKPDILVCSLWKSIPAALLAKLLRPQIGLVSFLHTLDRQHVFDSAFHSLLFRFAAEVWADSSASIAATVRRRFIGRERVISYVSDGMTRVGPASPPAPVFVGWARLHPDKRVDRALQLIALLAKRGIAARYEHWGPDQGLGDELLALAGQLGIADRVRFHGAIPREQFPAASAGATFMVQLSRIEGMAVSVVEAMQLGLVPVVTPVGQIASYCRDGDNALLVDADALDDAADRIARLLADPAKVRQMSKMARAEWLDAPLYAHDMVLAGRELMAHRPA
jgi:glycosyltransferase involved in cell wall biosynthesis